MGQIGVLSRDGDGEGGVEVGLERDCSDDLEQDFGEVLDEGSGTCEKAGLFWARYSLTMTSLSFL